MFKVVREHPKVFWAVIIIIIVVSILSVYEKQKYNPYEKQIGNPPRENKVFDDNFYYEKLTDNEKKAYEKIKDAIVNFKGGELTFDSPLNGKEYSRVTQALYCGEDDLFYAIVNVPMTENNQSVSSVTKNITDIKEQTIIKCIILLYPAEGINEQGDIDDQGYVKNLEDLKNPLATMNEDKKSMVLEMQQADNMLSLDSALADSENFSLGNVLGQEDASFEHVENHDFITYCMSLLNDTEKKIIEERYLRNKTQKQVADILNVSQMQVSRMERKILGKLAMVYKK